MKFKRRLKIQKGKLDITPLIDVVFLLLIFFMLSSSFILQPGVRIDLPKAVTTDMIKNQNTIITITENRHIYINDKITSLETLADELSNYSKESVVIQSDGRVELQMVVSVWDICRKIGVSRVNIATKQQPLGR